MGACRPRRRLLVTPVVVVLLAGCATSTVPPTLHLASSPFDAAVDLTGNLWVIGRFDDTLRRIDTATVKVADVAPLSEAGGADAVSIAVGDGSVWVGTNGPCDTGQSASGCLLRIDPGSGKQLAAIPIGVGPNVAVGAGAVWVTTLGDDPDTGQRTLGRIDPLSNRVVATIPIVCPCSVAADDSAVWVAGPDFVVRIDPATNRVVAEVGLGGYPNGAEVAIGAGAVWVAYWGFPLGAGGALTGHLVRIDPATSKVVADIPVPGANGLAVGVDTVWIATGHSVVRVDARVNAVVSDLTMAGAVDGVGVAEHAVWVWSAQGFDTVWRIAY